MSHKCPHCGKEINPAQMLGRVRSPRKEEAARKNGENMKRMWAALKKEGGAPVVTAPVNAQLDYIDWSKVPIPSAPAKPEIVLPPRPATLEGKKAAALAALGNMGKAALLDEVGAVAVPSAPFDVNIEGEPHRVTMMGKRLGLFYLGSGEPTFSRYLEQGEMEKLWEARIK